MIFRRGLIAVLALTLAWLQVRIWVGQSSLTEVDKLRARVRHEQAINEVKAQRNNVLRAEVVDLKTGVAAIEEKARSELGLVKQGETFFLVVGPQKAADRGAEDNGK